MLIEALKFLRDGFGVDRSIATVVEGRTYKVSQLEAGPQLGDLVTPPVDDVLHVGSATGFVDAFMAQVGDFPKAKVAVHVKDHETIALVSLETDRFGRRKEYLRAKSCEVNPFPFNTYQAAEMFLINLQSGFLPTEEVISLQRLASSISNDSSIGTQDDGLSQTISVKSGAVSRAEVKLPPRIKLFPYRTFREIAPVQSEFMVRLKAEAGSLPKIGLIEIDAGAWKHDTALLVKNWLRGKLPSGTIVIA